MRVGPRLRSAAMIAIFDIGGPLLTYSWLRSDGIGTVTSLIVSGAFPAIGVVISIIARRQADAIGILVLAGIAVGTALGLISHSARLIILEGSVPTGLFGLACLGSLWRRRPLMFRFALEFIGPDSQKGREFDGLWQYKEFRHAFRNLTTVWGVAYLMEAAARIVIVQHASAGVALTVSKVMPLAVTAVLALWTIVYSTYQKRKGERLGAAAMAISEVSGAGPNEAPPVSS